jgi:hypothetical protein
MVSLSIVFTLGIIWRVEMKLDRAYKIFFGALIFLLLAMLVEVFIRNETWIIINRILTFLFALSLLAGVWMMRDVMRDVDGEKK